ncbi:F-box domain [Arabidopsis thaliana x Arabidopsis arenosa]|uniref:F-box domain n=1 Tax=Arabidopsis thaliana x Arabidopsis arenosa TaxID=1240361 RepID=A0A8T1YDY5_9BRAS|nr:F-box domain [Arabidopsis thaliana x Arabidopsis arenosa]
MKLKKKKKVIIGGYRDLISGLPDALICHILSFLPTKEAASTTVLAKRWKPLLAFVPNLEFDDSFYFHPPMTYKERRKNSEDFMRFVDSVLALKAKAQAPLNRFHVKCEDVVDQYWVLEWIPKVLKRGVLDIDLRIPTSLGYCSRSSFYTLPSNIFVSKTLVKLKIEFEDGVNIYVKGDVSLPKLKILHLDYFQTDTSTFNKLISGCHVLEELVLINLKWNWNYLEPQPCSVIVSVPTLKRLKFCHSETFYEVEDVDEANESVSFSFDNPNLVYLEYSDSMADKYQQVSFDSLVEASLGLRMTPDQIVHVTCSEGFTLEPRDKNNLKNLLMGICNVKILYLSCDTLKVLNDCSETIPGLHHHYTKRCDDEDGCLCKCPDDCGGNVIRNGLLSSPVKVLKILKFGGICDDDEGVETQSEQVKHFLKTMPNLEQMILYYDTPNDQDVMKVCKKLQKLRRVASAKCNVKIISDNLSLSSTMSTKRGGRRYFSNFKNLR